MKVKFLVTPVALMMGNVVSARRLASVLQKEGISVTDDPDATDYDILHVHTPVPLGNINVVRKARERGIPVVMHAHTTAEDARGTWTGSTVFSPQIGHYLTKFYNLGDAVIVPSAWTKNTLRRRGVLSPIHVVSNGVDLERFRFCQERRARFRKAHEIPEETMVVYSIGVMCLKKGITEIPKISRALPNLHFVWVGKRSLFYTPFEVSRALASCGENVQILTEVDDIVDAHCGGDIFLMPSFTENQGIVVLEALAVGRPVVARRLSVYDGLLKNGENALTCSGTKDFVCAVSRLSKDRHMREKLSSHGTNALEGHEINGIGRKLVGIYESLLSGNGRVP